MKKNLQDRIHGIEEYFRGIEMYNDCLIVKVVFPNRWNVSNSMDDAIKVAASETAANEYYYYADSNECDYDDIFDLIEATINGNKDTFLKLELLKEKVEELRSIFSDGTITVDMLRSLRFVMDEPKKKKGRKSKKSNKVEENGQGAEDNASVQNVVVNDDVQ